MRKYSLQIPTTGTCDTELRGTISRLAKQYSSPLFEPHITLAADIEGDEADVIRRVAQLGSSLQPATLELGEISMSSTYFQSVFVRVKATAWLMDLYLKSRAIFGLPTLALMPHIGLVYGIDSMSEREALATELTLESTDFVANQLTVVSFDPSTNDTDSWQNLGYMSLG